MGKAGRSYATSKETVQAGMQGVLVTCFRNVESKCTSELYQLLSRVMESAAEAQPEGEASTLSFEEQIKAEVGELKDRSDKPFMAVDTKGLQCIVFLRALKDVDPAMVVGDLFRMIREREIKSIKFCQRIMPMQVICLARIEEIRQEVTKLIATAFDGPASTFSVVFESRLNDSLDRMTIIDMVAEIVGPKHKVNLSSPDKVVLIQVFKAHCGMSILENWAQNRKYNVQEVLKSAIEAQNKSSE